MGSSFSVVDPQNLHHSSDLGTLEVLSLNYGQPKNVELKPLLNIHEPKEEWAMFKQMMLKNVSGSSIQEMAKKLLHSDEVEEVSSDSEATYIGTNYTSFFC